MTATKNVSQFTAVVKNDYDKQIVCICMRFRGNREKSITITGGKLYYLHLRYRKDGSVNSNSSTFITNINDNVKIIGYYKGINNNYGTININGGSVVSGTITNRATGYVINVTTVNSKERYYLSL